MFWVCRKIFVFFNTEGITINFKDSFIGTDFYLISLILSLIKNKLSVFGSTDKDSSKRTRPGDSGPVRKPILSTLIIRTRFLPGCQYKKLTKLYDLNTDKLNISKKVVQNREPKHTVYFEMSKENDFWRKGGSHISTQCSREWLTVKG